MAEFPWKFLLYNNSPSFCWFIFFADHNWSDRLLCAERPLFDQCSVVLFDRQNRFSGLGTNGIVWDYYIEGSSFDWIVKRTTFEYICFFPNVLGYFGLDGYSWIGDSWEWGYVRVIVKGPSAIILTVLIPERNEKFFEVFFRSKGFHFVTPLTPALFHANANPIPNLIIHGRDLPSPSDYLMGPYEDYFRVQFLAKKMKSSFEITPIASIWNDWKVFRIIWVINALSM